MVIIAISKISSVIRKSRLCSTQSVHKLRSEGSSTYNQRGQSSGPCRLCGGLDNARHLVPAALWVRVQCVKKSLYMAVEEPSTRHMVFSMISGSNCWRRRRFTIFCSRGNGISWVPDPSMFVNASAAPSNTIQVWSVDAIGWESRYITTQPGERRFDILTLNPSRKCVTCGTKWPRTGP